MKKTLSDWVETYLTTGGHRSAETLCVNADLSASTLRKIRRGHIPFAPKIYSIARACGATEPEALRLSRELRKKKEAENDAS